MTHVDPRRSALALTAALLWLFAVAIGPVAVAAASPSTSAPPAGPPFPEPVHGQAVYDYAGILSPASVARAEATIAPSKRGPGNTFALGAGSGAA